MQFQRLQGILARHIAGPRSLLYGSRRYETSVPLCQTAKQINYENDKMNLKEDEVAVGMTTDTEQVVSQIFPTSRVVPVVISKKDPAVLSFDEVPGPKALKYLSSFRQYLSEVGTQITAGTLTLGINLGK